MKWLARLVFIAALLTWAAGVLLAIGTGLLRNARASQPVGVLAATLGVILGDLALVQLLDGPALTLGWAVAAVGFAVLVRFTATRGGTLAEAAAGAGLAGHVALGLLHGVMADVPPEAILGGSRADMAASGSLAALAAACLTAGPVLAHRPRTTCAGRYAKAISGSGCAF